MTSYDEYLGNLNSADKSSIETDYKAGVNMRVKVLTYSLMFMCFIMGLITASIIWAIVILLYAL